jgi:hypothetical protein
MNRLFLLRLSKISPSNLYKDKINLVINLSIFVIIFALTASIISLLFENRIEDLENRIQKNEINHIVYTKWLSRSPKIIVKIDNLYQSRKDERLFSKVITSIPDDDNTSIRNIYSPREEYFNYYYYLSDVITINFKDINLVLKDAIFISQSEEDIKLIKKQKDLFLNLVNEYDKIKHERLQYIDKNKDTLSEEKNEYYSDFNKTIKKQIKILERQKLFFLDFTNKYFSDKREEYSNNNSKDLKEINELSFLETRFIIFAFIIQFMIFVILQILEVSLERRKK